MATSSLGVLIREGLALGLGPSHANILRPNNPVFLALGGNMVGCLFRGALVPIAAAFSEPVHTALALGFCSAITSYCAWNQAIAGLVYEGHVLRGIAALLLGLWAPYCTMWCGVFLSRSCTRLCCRGRNYTGKCIPSSDEPSLPVRIALCVASVLVLAIVVAITIATATPLHGSDHTLFQRHNGQLERRIFLAACLGPVGTLIRWAATWLNHMRPFLGMPWGTLLANALSSALFAGMVVAQSRTTDSDRVWVSESFGIGLFGCMSTASTFMTEVDRMARDTTTLIQPLLYLCVSFTLSAWS